MGAFVRYVKGIPAQVHRWSRLLSDERGDVPGWVLVTVMTAGLVTAIWVLADEQLKQVLARAMSGLGTR